jgi:radical SAM-linked protein
MSEKPQFRYRIEYAKKSVMRYTSHLDTLRAWERTFRRAQLPLAFTQGFNPRPRINLGLALPLGFTSECELMDLWLTKNTESISLLQSIRDVLPPGLEIKDIFQINLDTPTLQKQIHEVMYSIHLDPFPPINQLQGKIKTLLASPEILRERRGKTYDLRPLVLSLVLMHPDDEPSLKMCLSAREGRTGRPDEVLIQLNLDLSTAQVHRKLISLMDPPIINIQAL